MSAKPAVLSQAVTQPPINAQLPTAATNRLAVTEVAVVQTCHPSRYTHLRLSIP